MLGYSNSKSHRQKKVKGPKALKHPQQRVRVPLIQPGNPTGTIEKRRVLYPASHCAE